MEENLNVTEQEVQEEQEVQVEYQVIDYTGQLETIIEMQTTTNQMLAQNNVNQLFTIGCSFALVVCVVLYNALKKFL